MNIPKFKWILVLSGTVVVVLLFRTFALTTCHIPSSGMENSLFQGERILVNKWSYGLRTPFMSVFSYHRWNSHPIGRQDVVVFNNPAGISQPIADRREVYIGRCIGTPGDTLFIDSLFTVASSETQFNPDRKRLYSYPAEKESQVIALMNSLSIVNEALMGGNDSTHVRSFSHYEYYLLQQALDHKNYIHPLSCKGDNELKPLIVPGKGSVLRVYPWNITLLRNTLVMHEGKQAEVKNDTLYVNGKATQHCYFTKNYYWMGSNNAINLSDSRLFGFVPQDHVIGKASLIWFSKQEGTGWFEGYRWNRFFRTIK